MIVHQCDWCGVQAQHKTPESWAEARLDGGQVFDRGHHQLWAEQTFVICTACVSALKTFIEGRKAKQA